MGTVWEMNTALLCVLCAALGCINTVEAAFGPFFSPGYELGHVSRRHGYGYGHQHGHGHGHGHQYGYGGHRAYGYGHSYGFLHGLSSGYGGSYGHGHYGGFGHHG